MEHISWWHRPRPDWYHHALLWKHSYTFFRTFDASPPTVSTFTIRCLFDNNHSDRAANQLLLRVCLVQLLVDIVVLGYNMSSVWSVADSASNHILRKTIRPWVWQLEKKKKHSYIVAVQRTFVSSRKERKHRNISRTGEGKRPKVVKHWSRITSLFVCRDIRLGLWIL